MIGAITGSIAEAYYGVPEDVICAAIEYLDSTQMEILYYFEERYPSKAVDISVTCILSCGKRVRLSSA